jgi:hypothetical protein
MELRSNLCVTLSRNKKVYYISYMLNQSETNDSKKNLNAPSDEPQPIEEKQNITINKTIDNTKEQDVQNKYWQTQPRVIYNVTNNKNDDATLDEAKRANRLTRNGMIVNIFLALATLIALFLTQQSVKEAQRANGNFF